MRVKSLFGAIAVAGVLLALPTSAVALPVCGGSTDVTTYNAGGGCTIGSLVFNNFRVVDASDPSDSVVDAVSSFVIGDVAYFGLNPNLGEPGESEDIQFFFTVTGLVNGVDLSNAGSAGTSIDEHVCNAAFNPSNICTGTQLADLVAAGGQSKFADFATTGKIWIYKDIFKGAEDHMTSFTQSFHEAVPEPASLLLLGSGLIAVASRFRQKRRS